MAKNLEKTIKIINELRNELNLNKNRFEDILEKLRVKLSSFYQLFNDETHKGFEIIRDKETKGKFFRNILNALTDLEIVYNESISETNRKLDRIIEMII